MIEEITITLEGLHEENGDIRLGELVLVLDKVRSALVHANHHISGHRRAILHVTKLSQKSPATATIQNRKETKGLFHNFTEALHHMGDGKAAEIIGYAALEDVLDATKRVELKRVGGISINGSTSSPTYLDIEFAARIRKELAPTETSRGTVEGMLEALNLHAGANRFTIFPVSVERGITCIIPERLHDVAIAHVRHKVRVTGAMKFRPRDMIPCEVNVEEIYGFPPDSELPRFEELRGIAPEMTGDLTTEEYLDEIRDAWG